ncbi:hypothetical protein E2C01_012346 [Portunus trituberculatus]|uniref:Uncharacterized protein n=1 Tax=Portunus trituberculatus TaxID=210409 RepID=A0A5B7DDD6_PORTR|nr:hypothetical protein [Portunus trituberculatus]
MCDVIWRHRCGGEGRQPRLGVTPRDSTARNLGCGTVASPRPGGTLVSLHLKARYSAARRESCVLRHRQMEGEVGLIMSPRLAVYHLGSSTARHEHHKRARSPRLQQNVS